MRETARRRFAASGVACTTLSRSDPSIRRRCWSWTPQHTRYRKQVARAFTARKVGRMSDRVESVAERPLDDLARDDGIPDRCLTTRAL